jgi:hypothetical protein
MLLVPAFMGVLGWVNWWAPGAFGAAAPAYRYLRIASGA